MPLYILFIIFPLLELWAFVEVSSEIGFFTALLLLILSAAIGSALIRHQGFQTIIAMHDAAERGKIPLNTLFDGFCIVAAGILLILPGFLSDLVAILLLIPRLRNFWRGVVKKNPKWHSSDTTIIEGEYEHIDDDPKALP